MDKIAVFPGSFDPFTIGHETIVKRSIDLFDKIIIAIGYNSTKKGFFSIEQRKKMIEKIFENYKTIEVEVYEGLTVDYCKEIDADFILRGLRNPADFEFEKAIAHTNRELENIETVFLLTSAKTSFIGAIFVAER